MELFSTSVPALRYVSKGLWPHYLKALFVYILVWYCCTVQSSGQVYTESIMFLAICVLPSVNENAIAQSILLGSKNVKKEGALIFEFEGYLDIFVTMKNEQSRALPLFSQDPHSK